MRLDRKVCVAGVGMTKFHKPAAPGAPDLPALALEATGAALAGVGYAHIEQAFVGYVFGDSTCGQRALYGAGMTGIPIYNVNNNCATGATALMLAYQAIGAGVSDCVLALGFEKMQKGALAVGGGGMDPFARHLSLLDELQPPSDAPLAVRMFGGAAREHAQRYGTRADQLARVAVKNRRHGAANDRAQFRHPCTLEEVLASPMIYEPMTKLQCCPTTDGAAAAVLCSEERARQLGLTRPVTIEAIALVTDLPSTFAPPSLIKMVGADLSAAAARQVYEQSGVGPEDVDVIELHDCFTINELLTYEALGLCAEGEGGKLIDDGAVTYGGDWVVNPSGGLLSKGHPLGATGLAQLFELDQQLRGLAGARQVEGARLALQHNLGLGGACVVALYRRD